MSIGLTKQKKILFGICLTDQTSTHHTIKIRIYLKLYHSRVSFASITHGVSGEGLKKSGQYFFLSAARRKVGAFRDVCHLVRLMQTCLFLFAGTSLQSTNKLAYYCAA